MMWQSFILANWFSHWIIDFHWRFTVCNVRLTPSQVPASALPYINWHLKTAGACPNHCLVLVFFLTSQYLSTGKKPPELAQLTQCYNLDISATTRVSGRPANVSRDNGMFVGIPITCCVPIVVSSTRYFPAHHDQEDRSFTKYNELFSWQISLWKREATAEGHQQECVFTSCMWMFGRSSADELVHLSESCWYSGE